MEINNLPPSSLLVGSSKNFQPVKEQLLLLKNKNSIDRDLLIKPDAQSKSINIIVNSKINQQVGEALVTLKTSTGADLKRMIDYQSLTEAPANEDGFVARVHDVEEASIIYLADKEAQPTAQIRLADGKHEVSHIQGKIGSEFSYQIFFDSLGNICEIQFHTTNQDIAKSDGSSFLLQLSSVDGIKFAVERKNGNYRVITGFRNSNVYEDGEQGYQTTTYDVAENDHWKTGLSTKLETIDGHKWLTTSIRTPQGSYVAYWDLSEKVPIDSLRAMLTCPLKELAQQFKQFQQSRYLHVGFTKH